MMNISISSSISWTVYVGQNTEVVSMLSANGLDNSASDYEMSGAKPYRLKTVVTLKYVSTSVF